MTGKIWFTADLHFGHEKVSRIRGFDTPFSHDYMIAETWKKQVAPDDIVYVLGDISSGRQTDELQSLRQLMLLPGRKRLIAGNHDSISGIHRKSSPNEREFRTAFDQINDYGRIRMNNQQVLLSHYPYWSQGDGPTRGPGRYEQYRLPDLGGALIHGHTHHKNPFDGSVTGREMCVSWDAWGTLVNIDQVAAWVDALDELKEIAHCEYFEVKQGADNWVYTNRRECFCSIGKNHYAPRDGE